MGMLWSTQEAPGPGLFDRLLRPDWSKQEDEAKLAEIEKTKATAEHLKQQNELIKLGIKEKQQILEWATQTGNPGAALSNPKVTSLLDMLSRRSSISGQPQSPPPSTVEETGELFRPTQEMLQSQQKPGLSSQVANQQIFGGTNPDALIQALIAKEFDIANPAERVGREKRYVPGKGWVMSDVNKYGTLMPGSEGPMPPEWKETEIDTEKGRFKVLRNMSTGEIDWSTATAMALPGSWQTRAGGPTGTENVMVPSQLFPGQQAPSFPGPVKGEKITITGPQGEQRETFVNPMLWAGGGTATGGPIAGGMAQGIETKPKQAGPVAVAQQIQMMKSGFDALKKVKDGIFDPNTGEINRTNLFNARIGMPWTEGKRMGDLIGAALNAIRLASTGAAFSPKELEDLKAQYVPGFFGNDQEVYDQWDMIGKFVHGMLQQMDPNEVFTKDVQKEYEGLMSIPGRGASQQKPGRITMEHEGNRFVIPEDQIDRWYRLYPNSKRVQ